MNRASEHAFALAVDDSHLVNVIIDTRAEILIHQRCHLPGVECVEVEDAVDRDMDYVIILHGRKNSKSEIRSPKQYRMTEIRNIRSERVSDAE